MKDKAPAIQSAQSLSILLIVMCCFFLFIPLLPYLPGFRFLFRIGLSIVFIANLLAHRHNRIYFRTALSLVILGILLTWTTLGFGFKSLVFAHHIETALVLALTAVSILFTVIGKHAATMTSIVGAMLVYLLFGLSWALLYSGIHHIDETAFSVPDGMVAPVGSDDDDADFSVWVYFSFVTMSTLGYGDISPQSPFAQTFTWGQSVAGQFYLAILVARLISILPERKRD